MPKDKTVNHAKIVKAARKEFLKHGYVNASMRRIASAAGMSVAGLYKHFAGKEEMFSSLVEQTVDELRSIYKAMEKVEYEKLNSKDKTLMWDSPNSIVTTMEFIYNHLDVFKLVVCKSEGTKYENFVHDIARYEEMSTYKYMEEMKARGHKVKDIDPKEFHLLVTSNINAIMQAVTHDFSREEAIHYATTLETFYKEGYKAVFGI